MSREAQDRKSRACHLGWAAVVAAGAIPLLIYSLTLQRTVPAGDSGEFISVVHGFGVAHPSGYPLYTLVGKLFSFLVPLEDVALLLNFLSALLNAAALTVLALSLYRLTGSRLASLVASLGLGFSAAFWKYSLVAEAFALNNLLASLLLFAFAGLLGHASLLGPNREQDGGQARRPWPLALIALLTSLLVTHHHTLVLLAAPVGLLAGLACVLPEARLRRVLPGFQRPYALDARVIGALAGIGLLGLLPLLQLPWAALGDPVVNWDDPRTPARMLHLLLRLDYGTLNLSSQEQALEATTPHAWLYLQSIPRDFGPAGLLLLVLGMALLWRRKWRPLLLLLLPFLALHAVFFAMFEFPSDRPVYLGVVERFYILPDLVLTLLLGVGAAQLLAWAQKPWRVGVVVLLLASPVLPLALHWERVSQHDNRFTEDLGRNLLDSLPQDAVLFSHGDIYTNAVHYQQVVLGHRPDVVFIDQTLMSYDWYVRGIRHRYPGLLPPLGEGERVHLLGRGTLSGSVVENDDARPYLRFRIGARSLLVDKRLVAALERTPDGDRLRWIHGGVLEGKILGEGLRMWGGSGFTALLTADAYLHIDPALMEDLDRSPEVDSMFREQKERYHIRPDSEDRYSGHPDTMNLLWLDHLMERRPVAFLGFKDPSYQVRYAPVQEGLVQRMVPKDRQPGVEQRLDIALSLLETLDLSTASRTYDPSSFETDSHAIYWNFASSVVDLLLAPETRDLPVEDSPGVAKLLLYLEAQAARGREPGSLRALGALHYANPSLRDHPKALRSLEAYLRVAPPGAEADNARGIVEFLRSREGQ